MILPTSIINIILDNLSQIQNKNKYTLSINEKSGKLFWKPNKYNDWFRKNALKINQNPTLTQSKVKICDILSVIEKTMNQQNYDFLLDTTEYNYYEIIDMYDCEIKELYSYPVNKHIFYDYVRSYDILYISCENGEDKYYAFIHMYSNEEKYWLTNMLLKNKKKSYLWKNGTPIGLIEDCNIFNLIYPYIIFNSNYRIVDK